MSFIWPPMLLSIALIPLGIWLHGRIGARRRRVLVRAFGAAALVVGETGIERGRPGPRARGRGAARSQTTPAGDARPAGPPGGSRAHRFPSVLVVAGLVVMAVALARPEAVVALPRQEGTVILAFDVSGSMAATDISPTRMAAAKAAAKDFVAKQPDGIAIGIVAFSDSGAAVQAPTTDPVAVDDAIERLAPQKGTSVASGISASLQAIAAAARGAYGNDYYTLGTPAPTPTPTPVPAGVHAPAVIVLLSDGENNENPDPMTAAQAAANLGVRVYTVGIGSEAGTNLDVNGVHVHTQLDAAQLQAIAALTGGSYYSASSAQQLRSVYDGLDTQLVSRPELTELTPLFAGASLVLLFAGSMLSLLWFRGMP